MTKTLTAVPLGSGIGSLLHYCVRMALHERVIPYSFPWATLAVNITRSFLIGLFCVLSARFNLSTEVRMLLTIGLRGGLTTFSTFFSDGLILVKQGFYGLFATCTLLSTLLSIFVALDGSVVGRTF